MKPTRTRPDRAAGFSLIELLVSMVIGLVVTLAISTVMIRTESSKRSTTSVNDISQTSAYIGYVLDRSIRSAGSGYSQNWQDAYGCVLDVSYANQAVLPMPAPALAPFANVPTTFRLAPLLIGKGLADAAGQVRGDVIVAMDGTSGLGETPQPVLPGVTSSTLRVTNPLGYSTTNSLTAGNLILLADSSVTSGCLMEQVGSNSSGLLTLGGNYYKAAGNTNTNVTSFGVGSVAIQLGGDPSNAPQFQMFGVGDNNTLSTYNLLKPPDASTNPVTVADGVVEMRALYGIAAIPTTTPITVSNWIDPGNAASGYTMANLTDGSFTAQQKLRSIVAVRIGLFMRTSLQEQTPIGAGTTLKLFSDLGAPLQQTRTISGSDLYFRFRTVEFTVPLRNLFF